MLGAVATIYHTAHPYRPSLALHAVVWIAASCQSFDRAALTIRGTQSYRPWTGLLSAGINFLLRARSVLHFSSQHQRLFSVYSRNLKGLMFKDRGLRFTGGRAAWEDLLPHCQIKIWNLSGRHILMQTGEIFKQNNTCSWFFCHCHSFSFGKPNTVFCRCIFISSSLRLFHIINIPTAASGQPGAPQAKTQEKLSKCWLVGLLDQLLLLWASLLVSMHLVWTRSIYKQSYLYLNIFVHAYVSSLHICTCISHQDTPFVCTSNPLVSALPVNARHVTEKSRVILNFLTATPAHCTPAKYRLNSSAHCTSVYINTPALLKCQNNL